MLNRYPLVFLVFFSLMALLPFVNRAVFVDDHAHFKQAQQLSDRWSVPYSSNENEMGWIPGESPSEANPLVYFYTMGTWVKIVGNQEWKAHLLVFGLAIIGLLFFYDLSKHYTKYPLWACLLWLVSPHFWLTTNSLLVDSFLGPIMIIGVASWVKGWREKNNGWLLLGALFIGLAALTKYTGLLAGAAAVLWTWFEGKREKKIRWLFLALPAGLFLAWMFWTRSLYGGAHFQWVAETSMVWPSMIHAMMFLIFLSGCTPFLLIAFPIISQEKVDKKTIVFSGIALALFIYIITWKFKLSETLQLGFWFVTTLTWIFLLTRMKKPYPKGFHWLLSWILMGALGLVFARAWFCGRYFVVLGPAVILLTLQLMEKKCPKWISSFSFRASLLAGLALLSGAMAAADYQQANIYRRAALDLNQLNDEQLNHQKGVYSGTDLTGLSYYLDEKKWEIYAPGEALNKGQILLVANLTMPNRMLPPLTNPSIVTKKEYTSWLPLRTLGKLSASGFYGSCWGPLPISFSTKPMEIILLIQDIVEPQN